MLKYFSHLLGECWCRHHGMTVCLLKVARSSWARPHHRAYYSFLPSTSDTFFPPSQSPWSWSRRWAFALPEHWPENSATPLLPTPPHPHYRPPSARPYISHHITPFHPASASTLPSHSPLAPWLTSLPQLPSLSELHICPLRPCFMLCNPSVLSPSYTNKLRVSHSTRNADLRSGLETFCQHTLIFRASEQSLDPIANFWKSSPFLIWQDSRSKRVRRTFLECGLISLVYRNLL